MSRGFGAVQRRVLDALLTRGEQDRYPVVHDDVAQLAGKYADRQFALRARWRWYTLDLLGLAQCGSSRAERVSLHRAIKALEKASRVETMGQLPYPQPFAAYFNYAHQLVGGIDLNELSMVDTRWPSGSGRTLWFRLPPPHPDREPIPKDDQLAVFNVIETWRPDSFEDFAASIDHASRWTTHTGRFLAWLFCGPPGQISPALKIDEQPQ